MNKYKRMVKKYKKLLIPLGIGEIAVALTSMTDMIAVGTLGTATLAGYSMATYFIELMYVLCSALRATIYPEYSKYREGYIISSFMVMSIAFEIGMIVIGIIALPILLSLSGLSKEANQIVYLTVSIRIIGVSIYLLSCCYYSYLRIEGYEKQSAVCRILCAACNIVLDIAAVVFKQGLVGVLLATCISEGIEFLAINIVCIRNKIRFDSPRISYIKKIFKKYLYSFGTCTENRVMDLMTGLAVSQIGDSGYAVYGIIGSIVVAFCSVSYTMETVVTTIYSTFKSEYEKITKCSEEITKITFRYSIVWWGISTILTPLFIYGFTFNNSIDVSFIKMCLINLIFIVTVAIRQPSLGVCRVENKYGGLFAVSSISMIIVPIVALIVAVYTKDPYLCILSFCIQYTAEFVYGHKVCSQLDIKVAE